MCTHYTLIITLLLLTSTVTALAQLETLRQDLLALIEQYNPEL